MFDKPATNQRLNIEIKTDGNTKVDKPNEKDSNENCNIKIVPEFIDLGFTINSKNYAGFKNKIRILPANRPYLQR